VETRSPKRCSRVLREGNAPTQIILDTKRVDTLRPTRASAAAAAPPPPPPPVGPAVTPPAACVADARPAGGGVFLFLFFPPWTPVVLNDARRARSSAHVRPAPLQSVRAPGGGHGDPLMNGRARHGTGLCGRVDRR